jgi:hypothetical protein
MSASAATDRSLAVFPQFNVFRADERVWPTEPEWLREAELTEPLVQLPESNCGPSTRGAMPGGAG